MEIDTDRIDEVVLGLLWLTLHDDRRAWKGHDWDVMNRLYERGMIYDPVNKAKSVVLTDEGLAKAEQLFRGRCCKNLLRPGSVPSHQ
ncbi:DUF6429 family protein [Pukyongiella litopenaei]|uniref:DUF6429 domain-containing protein n=1 Tax=Pukyongiella litopenaei TaxID=2605946 RepID=A0A5C2H2C2_9RHOB|nr:DUF6429 family protein [Pukyongiella litopenaei]QEP30597.1 hypothetical protein C6Y53_20565 [Pukyongiella litopenaei]